MADLSGTSLKGYDLHVRIGVGGFGAVYRAFQSTIGREVAIKIILPGHANKPEFIRRFETEAQLVARLEHLHIVPLYDYWRDPEGAYLVMRYLRGGNLKDMLTQGAFELEASVTLLNQITSALNVAHSNQVVHRDIKPANILLDEDANAYLADFGIAKDVAEQDVGLTDQDAMIGSPDYFAPEQARTEPVTPQTDIYTLGVVLYELLTGEHPFPNRPPLERMFAHLNEPIPEIMTLDKEISDDINQVIQKATAKDPARRFADVLDMAAAFREAAALGISRADASVIELLTPREQEALKLIVEGRSNREIADKLTVEVSTVKSYVNRIYRKLNVRSRVQAIVKARELNLIVDGFKRETSTSPISQLPPPKNPYKGLQAFSAADEKDFFGRERMVKRLLKKLGQNGEFARFLAVVGPSGSGKSSLVKAGLIPALWRGELDGSDQWYVVDMTPGNRPQDELEVTLMRLASDQSLNLAEQLSRDEAGLLRAAQLILPNDGSELLIVIDQFEEVFTLTEDEEIRTHFLDLLHTAITESNSRVRVIVIMRADFYDRPLHYPRFGEMMRERMETVLPLGAEEMERAIVQPAKQVGVEFEEGLITSIVSEINYQPGALPLLQYAMTELFEAHDNRKLTHEAYENIGRAVGALARRAEDIYNEFDEIGKKAIREKFLRLVTLGDGAEDTRRRVARHELLAISGDPEVMDEVIDTYAAYRLLSLDNDPATRSPTVEVAHEAILREWERLRVWLDESRDDIRVQRQLAYATDQWREAAEDSSFLLRGSRLDQIENWRETSELALTEHESEFIAVSISQRQAEIHTEKERSAREKSLEQRSRTILRTLVAVFALATVISGGFGIFAFQQRQEAENSATQAQNVALLAGSQAALANNDNDSALALAWQAVALNPDSAVAQAQLSEVAYAQGTIRRFVGHTAGIVRVAISPDERMMISTSDDFSLILWDIETGEMLKQLTGHTESVGTVAFLPDGNSAISGSIDRTAILWDLDTGEIIRRYENYDNTIVRLGLHPEGRSFIAGGDGDDSYMVEWDVESGEILRRFDGPINRMDDIVFTPDGSKFISLSREGDLLLWDYETGEIIHEMAADLEESLGSLQSVAISPDGRTAIAGYDTLGIIIWDLSTGMMLQYHTNSPGVFSVAFHPTDDTVLVSNLTNSLFIMDVQTGDVMKELTGHNSVSLAVAILHNGRHAVSGSLDGTLRLWDLEGGQVIRRFAGMNPNVFEVDYSPDGRTALSGSTDGTVILWDMESGEKIHQFRPNQPVMAVTYSADGQTALIGTGYLFGEQDDPGMIILWDVESGEEIRRFTGHPYSVVDVEFSPNGNLAVSSGAGAVIILWDVETGEEIRRFEDHFVDSPWATESFWDVEFSPDGRTVFGAHASGPIYMWDIETGEQIGELLGHTIGALGLDFTAEGELLISGGVDNQAILWDLQTGEILRRLTNHAGRVGQVAFSPDEHLMLGGSADGTSSLWEVATGAVLRRYGNGFVMKSVFSSNGRQALVGFFDGAVELWRIDITLDDLLAWTQANRYIPELTCEQRKFYNVEPFCDPEE